MNINANELNRKFQVGDFVQTLFTKDNEDMGIAQMVGKLVNRLDADVFGADMYQVEFKISNLPTRILSLSTASFNPIDKENMAWRINTNQYWSNGKISKED